MNIYLLEQSYNSGYDTYDSCVVCAEDAEDAKTIGPNDTGFGGCWCEPKHIKCTLIGEAINQERGVICASFNAG